jgi:hypothetical protein
MESISITSSTKMIKASYDKDKKELQVIFATGKIYTCLKKFG